MDTPEDPGTVTFEQHRRLLLAMGYRMLGSRAEAEELVQDTWLRWRTADTRALRSPRAWLITAATRLAIDRLRHARRERLHYEGPWLPEPWAQETTADPADAAAELLDDVSMALMLLLERLTPGERAALLLHDVLDCSHAEVAAVLGASPATCRQWLHRARQRVRQPAARQAPSAVEHGELLTHFVTALQAQDHTALLALLADDVRWTADGGGAVRAARRPALGPRAVSRLASAVWRLWLGRQARDPAWLNGAPALVLRVPDGDVSGALLITARAARIARIDLILNPRKLESFP